MSRQTPMSQRWFYSEHLYNHPVGYGSNTRVVSVDPKVPGVPSPGTVRAKRAERAAKMYAMHKEGKSLAEIRQFVGGKTSLSSVRCTIQFLARKEAESA